MSAPADGGNDASLNPVHRLQSVLHDSIGRSGKEQGEPDSPAGACLMPLLSAIGWSGESRHLFEALPHFDSIEDVEGLRAALCRLNLQTVPRRTAPAALPDTLMPCLFAYADGGVFVLVEKDAAGQVLAFDGAARRFRYLASDTPAGTAFPVDREENRPERSAGSGRPWFEDVLSRFRATIVTLVLLSLVMNALSMLLPVYVMNVYDKVIGTGSIATLLSLLGGIAIAIVAEMRLRRIRTEALAFLGARFESLVSIGVVQQLLYFPVSMTESVSAGNQITRLKQFESVRDAFSGPLGATLLDLPFVLLFCAGVFVIGGPLGWIPLVMVLALLGLGAFATPVSNRLIAKAGEARTRNRNAMMELTHKHGSLREVAAESVWIGRYKDVAAEHFRRQFKAQQFNSTIQTAGQALVMSAGVAAMFFGAHMVLAGDLSIGALIAVMALVWRVLAPLQAAFMSLNRLSQMVQSIGQINRMMKLPIERSPGQLPTIFRDLKGAVELAQVSFRYSPRGEPVLRGVSLSVQPGEIVAVTGGSGAGKSTLLKTVAGLYKPQAGAVLVDGLDLRQINAGELRARIGIAPQYHDFFYGTLLQNIRLAHPGAERGEVERLLEELGAGHILAELPEGLDTRLGGDHAAVLDESFRQQLSLARAFIKSAPVYLLDEPGRNLDRAADEALIRYLARLRGRSTVLMVTHRPSQMRLADRLVVMRMGQIVADGPPGKVLQSLAAA